MSWAKDAWGYVLMYGREAGKWAGLIEESEGPEVAAQVVPDNTIQKAEAASSGPSWFGRTFGGLTTGRRRGSEATPRGLPPPGTYKVGEVHGDYVKVGAYTPGSLRVLIAERRRDVSAALARGRRPRFVGVISGTGCRVLVARGRQGRADWQDRR